MVRLIVITLGLAGLLAAMMVMAVAITAADYDRREEQWLEQQRKEKEQQAPDPEIYDACWHEEDKRHCGLLEDDDD